MIPGFLLHKIKLPDELLRKEDFVVKTVIGVFLACLLLSGCSKQNEEISLIVNGKKYSRQQIAKAAVIFKQNMMSAFPEQTLQSVTSDIRPIVARELITNQLMLEEAKKRKLQIDSNLVNKTFETFKSKYSSQNDFENELAALGETEDDVKKELEKGALLDTLLKTILVDADKVSEKECHDFYIQNSSRYMSSPRFRVSQIFFAADSSKDKPKWEKSRKSAYKLLEKLKAGMKFEAAAAANKQSDGDMGWFRKGDLKEELQNAVEQKKTGEISDVICTDIGLHIVKKTDEEAAKEQTFEEVRESVEKTLSVKKRTDYVSNFVDSLIRKAKVTYVDTTLMPRN